MIGLCALLPLAACEAKNNPRPGTGVGAINLGGSQWSNTRSYSLLISNTSRAPRVSRPESTSLVYFTGTDVNMHWSTGVPYNQASSNGWLLKDSSGNLLVNQGYPDNNIGDVGNTAYQHAWTANVLSFLAHHQAVKGIVIDDVLYDLTPLTDSQPAKYPTQQAWAAAQLSFIAAVGPALRAKGYYVLVNASGYVPGDNNSDTGANTATWWRELGPYVSGLSAEYWQETPNGTDVLRASGSANWMQNWDGWQALVTTAQSMGKDFVGVMHGAAADTRAMTYGKASFLLDWNGGNGAFVYLANDDSDPWNPAWTTNIGQPTGPKRRAGNGWMRPFTAGMALVNPDSGSSQTFHLGGSYLTADGTTVSSITLAPTTAAILRSPAPKK